MKPHRARILAMQAIYQAEFNNRAIDSLLAFDWIDYTLPQEERDFATQLIKGVAKNSENIDRLITKYSKNWDIKRISPVTRSIIRLSIYQLIHYNDIPFKVVINEALKLCQKYAEDDSGRFINGVLDAFYKGEIRKN